MGFLKFKGREKNIIFKKGQTESPMIRQVSLLKMRKIGNKKSFIIFWFFLDLNMVNRFLDFPASQSSGHTVTNNPFFLSD